jgi:hypothetical protein
MLNVVMLIAMVALYQAGAFEKGRKFMSDFFRSPPTVLPPVTMPWLLIDDDDDNDVENVDKNVSSNDPSVVDPNDVFNDDDDEFLLQASELFV